MDTVNRSASRHGENSAVAVRYLLSVRGLFSEFNNLAYGYAHCLAHGRDLFVNYRKSPTPWLELMSSFPPSVSELDPLRYAQVMEFTPKAKRDHWRNMRKDVRDACLEKRRISAPKIGFEGPFDELVFAAAAELFQPHQTLADQAVAAKRALGLENTPFCAVQLRRGDKTEGYIDGKGRLIVEMKPSSFKVYADCLDILAADVRDVLVLTDDYGAFEEARADYPGLRLHTLCSEHERGYFHGDHLARPPEERLANERKLIVTAMLARESEAFVGTFWSNLSTAVYMLHGRKASCASIDPQQEWPPFDPLFLPARDTLTPATPGRQLV